MKDIPRKNVNGGKAAEAIPLQIIRTTEQEPGRANQKVRKEREEQTEKVKLNAEGKSGRVSTWFESIKSGRGSGRISEESEKADGGIHNRHIRSHEGEEKERRTLKD